MKKKDRQAYIQIIKPMLTEKRFEHSLNVAQEAVKLPKKFGADPEKAETAGILRTNMILGCAITESTGIYSLVIALLMLFVF